MKDLSKEIQDAEQELSRLNSTYDSILRKMNISEAQIDELAAQVQNEPLPKDLQQAWDKMQADAKRAGEERAARTSQSFSAAKASSRKNIVRI